MITLATHEDKREGEIVVGDNTIQTPATVIENAGPNTAVEDIVFEPKAVDVAKCLVRSGAYGVMFAEPADQWLTWKNGIKAPVYCDCRVLNSFPLERKLVSATLVESAKRHFGDAQVVVAMATAGISWGRVVADELDLPFAYVRSKAKGHGTGSLVDGEPPTGKRAVVIDDLVASGGSILDAARALDQECGIQVIGVQSIVNWGFRAMRRNLAGYRVKALTSYPYIVLNAIIHELIDSDQFIQLLSFYRDPTHFAWPQLAPDEEVGPEPVE